MSVTVFKNCFGCGAPMHYAGFTGIPEEPMCRICEENNIKPRYVYIQATKEVVPKYDLGSIAKRSKARLWHKQMGNQS